MQTCYSIQQFETFIHLVPKSAHFARIEASELKTYIRDRAHETPKSVVLDLSNCDYLTSEGIGALVVGWKEMQKYPNLFFGIIMPVDKDHELYDMIQVTGLQEVLSGSFFNSLDEVKKFAAK